MSTQPNEVVSDMVLSSKEKSMISQFWNPFNGMRIQIKCVLFYFRDWENVTYAESKPHKYRYYSSNDLFIQCLFKFLHTLKFTQPADAFVQSNLQETSGVEFSALPKGALSPQLYHSCTIIEPD